MNSLPKVTKRRSKGREYAQVKINGKAYHLGRWDRRIGLGSEIAKAIVLGYWGAAYAGLRNRSHKLDADIPRIGFPWNRRRETLF